ncbi:lens intrinsic membrane protein 2.2 isoform X1 [Danio rerio]|uniref:Lens intrinsic membrane protein 2.2 isoform X1 n=1 Tax=Danio rerio TaxID=7955 RepID=A0AC58IF14_DANRE
MEPNADSQQHYCSAGGTRPELLSLHNSGHKTPCLIDGLHSGTRGLTVWCGGPRAPHHLHLHRLLDAVSLLRERSQSGALEVLHQSQVPRSHADRRILGCHPGLHAAVGAELLCWSPAGAHSIQKSQKQKSEDWRNHTATVRVSGSAGAVHLHRNDHQLLRPSLHRLAFLLVLHSGLDFRHSGSRCRSAEGLCVSEKCF